MEPSNVPASTVGSFTIPCGAGAITNMSQLINDTRFSSIREYLLDIGTLTSTSEIKITDLIPKSTIFRIELVVLEAMGNDGDTPAEIEVISGEDDTLLGKSWNDPSIAGTYVSNCYYTTQGTDDDVVIRHSLASIAHGVALLRLHVYNNIVEYQDLLTADKRLYVTQDLESIELIE